MGAMKFRKAVPEDLPELYDMAMEAAQALPYAASVDQESVEAYVDTFMGPERSIYLIARGELPVACFGVVLGTYWFNRNEEFAKIAFLFVKPEYRGRVSSDLMKFLRWLCAQYPVQFGFDSGGKIEAKDRFFKRFGLQRSGYNYFSEKV